MSFKELKLKSSYDTGEDDVVEAFYIPVLSKAISYDRIAGYFTSSSLAISARGLQYMIQKKGKMRLLVSPYLNREDVEMMQQASVDPMGYLEQSFADVLEEMNEHNLQHYRALMGWMIAHNLLEIKVVLIKHKDGRLLSRDEVDQTALFHQKIGICRDEEGSILTFSGSINETAAAWTKNVENFKVFQSWKAGQEEFCHTDAQNFLKYWYEQKEHVVIMNIPIAIRDKFIQYGDKDITEINSAIQQMKITKKEETISLFYYQKQAVEQWKKNRRHLLFEMATGSGKTRTAIACMLDLVNQNERNLFIVATPQSTLSKQWKTEVEAFYPTAQFSLVVDSTNTKAKAELEKLKLRINTKTCKNAIIYTTHKTCSSGWFVKAMNEIKHCDITFIGDEVHGLGSTKQQAGLLPCYKNRIGLSATPHRFFDDEGSALLKSYYGDSSFEFTIHNALTEINPITNKTFLCPYYYHLRFAELTEDELERYNQLSVKISKLYAMKKKDDDELLSNLLFKRANIIKAASNKLEVLEHLIDELIDKGIERTIVFTSPEQIGEVIQIFRDRKIKVSKFTEEQGTSVNRGTGLSERQSIIKKFKENEIKVLIAIKCLDEGIDIPEADTAILMASTKNPREYIQRIGRVIRNYPGKRYATIYDFITIPNSLDTSNDSILKKETERSEYIAQMAINGIDVVMKLHERMQT